MKWIGLALKRDVFKPPGHPRPPPSIPVSETMSKQYPDELSRWGYKPLYINWFLKKQ